LDLDAKVMKAMLESTVTDKGQTTVPKEVRDALGIKPRQRLQWDLSPDGTAVVRAEPSALNLFGSLKSHKKYPGVQEEKAAARKYAASRSVAKKN
jgi:antitoxin PrlF